MQRYPFLRFAAAVLRVVGWIALVLGVIASIAMGITTGMGGEGFASILMGAVTVIVGLIGSFLVWLFLLAARELFYLVMDVEQNTRNTAERIRE
ncbi:MAG: hypothetical protein R6U93_06955 [Dehalococcoidia bacterium]|jgi:hypothetical protein